MEFENGFKALTGFKPLSWQTRLYKEHLEAGELPAAVDIPTGLGKTAVMALWLIARACGATLPRRLVYVVDRRAVVDQATEFAIEVRENLDTPQAAHMKAQLRLNDRSLPISTLRGQHVDSREWLEDPGSAAIIVGTVDMIGSRLLFEGYGVSRKMRPYHAGLLGADTLVVLDEAHLVPPFEKLLETIEGDSKQFRARDQGGGGLIPAFKLLSLSATGRQRTGHVFRLKGSFDAPQGRREDLDDEIVAKRLKAEKLVTLVRAESGKLEETLAAHAWRLAEEGKAPIRCIIFSNERDIAESAKNEIEGLAKGDKKRERVDIDSALFVGARRVRERQNAADWLKDKGFIAGDSAKRTQPAFLFATSAGEVGVDLDADHMVCDLVAWERMVQRLGRVNRQGNGNARVIIVDDGIPQPKKKDAPTREESAAIQRYGALHSLLKALPKCDDDAESLLASPDALRMLKERAVADPEMSAIITAATTPAPLRPALTRALVDAWSMTSLEEHTGRPEVAPWLRGWVDEHPQTTVVWRKYLPVREKGADATRKEIEGFFEAAPPHASEQLETETYRVVTWLHDRCELLLKRARPVNARDSVGGESKSEDLDASADSADEVIASPLLRRNDTIAFVLSKSGELRQTLQLGDFFEPKDKVNANRLDRRLKTLVGAVIVIDARLGGLKAKDGLLNSDIPDVAETADDGDAWMPPLPVAGRSSGRSEPVVKFRVRSIAVAETDDPGRDWRERYRFAIERNEEGADVRWLVVDKWHGDSANENDRSASSNPQLLAEHQSWTESRARALAEKLGLASDWIEVIAIAARLHDEGKRASRWQRAFNAPLGRAPYAKTRGPINFALLDEYRHEFGSLPWAENDGLFGALPEEQRDLVLHLIAAHHGQARPVIGTKGCEDAPPSVLEERARQVALRFARLQKHWGPWGLAWWEALLRAADQQASRANDERSGENA